MWITNNNNYQLSMTEGDYGVALPITINGTNLSQADTIRLTIKCPKSSAEILVKDMTPTINTVRLELTEADTAKLRPGAYVYALDWYQDGNFLCNIIPCAGFEVVSKA